jgi:Flp pilus assembly pilin Flp
MSVRLGDLCWRLLREESGQDLIEYAILTGIVTVSSILLFDRIKNQIGVYYLSWESRGQERWIPNPPIAP